MPIHKQASCDCWPLLCFSHSYLFNLLSTPTTLKYIDFQNTGHAVCHQKKHALIFGSNVLYNVDEIHKNTPKMFTDKTETLTPTEMHVPFVTEASLQGAHALFQLQCQRSSRVSMFRPAENLSLLNKITLSV